ncbi:hypothetical protein RO575_03485 [Methylomonas sp. MO1]|uniref:hypothetical protein n=1 Tax=unclassified Methylomonas TaxID=2608980 RepID=UPI00047E2754|nr:MULTISPECIES: hypothetical protein [unclassified Methylomonas]MDT4288610.1 hypothetical protein [Methylomonas sp. MO1]
MNETTLVLCKKPIIGLAMWLMSMCVTNQALKDAFIDISKKGAVLDQNIDVPMDERYSLMLLFRSTEKYDLSNPHRSFFSYFCAYPQEQVEPWRRTSQKLALTVDIATIDGQSISHTVFEPLCESNPGNENNVALGYIQMKAGKYKMQITNNFRASVTGDGKVQIILRGAGAGYP